MSNVDAEIWLFLSSASDVEHPPHCINLKRQLRAQQLDCSEDWNSYRAKMYQPKFMRLIVRHGLRIHNKQEPPLLSIIPTGNYFIEQALFAKELRSSYK